MQIIEKIFLFLLWIDTNKALAHGWFKSVAFFCSRFLAYLFWGHLFSKNPAETFYTWYLGNSVSAFLFWFQKSPNSLIQWLFFLSFPHKKRESFLIRLLKTEVILLGQSMEGMISACVLSCRTRFSDWEAQIACVTGNLPRLSWSTKTTGIKGKSFC